MPSIIEVDTIKNKTGTQNTVLSTDGSGNNTLNAGVIKSNTGSNSAITIASDGQITVNQNNPTLTLGANTTFPSGHITKMETATTGTQLTVTATSYAGDNTTITPLSVTINKVHSSSKIWILCSPSIQAYQNGSGDSAAGARIIRGSGSPYTEIEDFGKVVRSYDAGDINLASAIICLQCVDSTTSTGNLTYSLEMKKIGGTDSRLNHDSNNDSYSKITVFEVM